MEKKFNFVYITTNLINGKQYVGDHSTNDLECSKTKKYLGGGRPYFKNAIDKYKPENFKREILEYFETKQEAFDAQEKYIKQFNTLTPNGYNISPTGGHGTNGGFLSEESKQKIRLTLTGVKRKPCSEETKEKIRKSQLGKIVSEETKQKQSAIKKGKVSSVKGKHWTEESKQKIRKPKSKEHCINIGKSKLGQTSWAKGKIFSDEYKQKLSESHIGLKQSQETIQKRCDKLIGQKRTEEQKQHMGRPRKIIS